MALAIQVSARGQILAFSNPAPTKAKQGGSAPQRVVSGKLPTLAYFAVTLLKFLT
jgi:hypothetical protein